MTDIIMVPVILITAVGAAAGLILSLAAKFAAVQVDATVEQVRNLLPGANCGACGYAGCDEYAQKVASNQAETNLCVPGGQALAKDLAKIMGQEAGAVSNPKAVVRCSGDCNSAEYSMEYQGPASCAASSMYFGGNKSCPTACLGFGDCANVCRFDAIVVKNGIAYIDPKRCTGCSACVKVCPKGVIRMIPKTNTVSVICASKQKGALTRKVCKVGCIACTRCQKTCRFGAIKVTDNLADIDPALCTNCGECVEVCPTKCIQVSA